MITKPCDLCGKEIKVHKTGTMYPHKCTPSVKPEELVDLRQIMAIEVSGSLAHLEDSNWDQANRRLLEAKAVKAGHSPKGFAYVDSVRTQGRRISVVYKVELM